MTEIIETAEVAAADAATSLGEKESASYDGPVLAFRTLPHAGSWTCSEGETYTDENVVENPSATLVRDAGHAHAAGVIEVTEGLDLTGVQSQEDGEAEYAKAVEDGRWLEGQLEQAEIDQAAKDSGEYGAVVEVVVGEDGTDAE